MSHGNVTEEFVFAFHFYNLDERSVPLVAGFRKTGKTEVVEESTDVFRAHLWGEFCDWAD